MLWNWLSLLICCVNISVWEAPQGASKSVGRRSLTDRWRWNPFTARPCWPMSRDATQTHGPGLPKITCDHCTDKCCYLYWWQVTLATRLHIFLNSKVNSCARKPGRLDSCLCPRFTQVAATGRPESPCLSTGALWGFTSPFTGASWVYSKGKTHHPLI